MKLILQDLIDFTDGHMDEKIGVCDGGLVMGGDLSILKNMCVATTLRELYDRFPWITPNTEIIVKNGVVVAGDISPDRPITEYIELFNHAHKWCRNHGHKQMVQHYNKTPKQDAACRDIDWYDMLRIITFALNEGWEPDFQNSEELWGVYYDRKSDCYRAGLFTNCCPIPRALIFKSRALAEYAAKQFAPYYAGFLGKKGGEE